MSRATGVLWELQWTDTLQEPGGADEQRPQIGLKSRVLRDRKWLEVHCCATWTAAVLADRT